MFIRKLDKKGDTIIEVLIVLAILGLALGISYSTANTSLLNVRQAQENAQATEILQSQIESIIGYASTDSAESSNLYTTNDFCFYDGLTITTTATEWQDNCQKYAQENSTPQYQITDLYCDTSDSTDNLCTSVSNDTFVANAQWGDVTGQGTDNVTLYYRLDQQ